jgi:putative integral membrane protein (TIGR02587 family)
MREALLSELRSQIRGVTGALLVVGLTFHYTMETWWLGWTLPFPYLVGYAFFGLVLVILLTRSSGFREERSWRRRSSSWRYVATEFAEVLMQSFVASYTILLIMGVIDVPSTLNLVVRLGLIEVVPLGFGAALANRLFRADGERANEEGTFPNNLALFSIGALFVASTIAPTQEMELIAAHMSWARHAALIALTLLLVYLMLYELEFKDQEARVQREWRYQIGTTFMVYMVGLVVSFLLLTGFGHFLDATLSLVYQETVVLAFPASLGAAAAEVVI